MGTDMDTGVALDTGFPVPQNPFIHSKGQRPGRALSHTGSAVYAEPSCFGIVTVFTVNIAALKENSSPVAWTIYTAERDNSVYNSFHQRTFLSRIWPFLEAPRPRPVVF